MIRAFVVVLLSVAAMYGLACAALYLAQHRLIYLPSTAVHAQPSDQGLAFEDLLLETGDGERIHAWRVNAPPGVAQPLTVLFLHGNAGNMSDRRQTLRLLHELGVETLMIDYRGFGRSSGSPNENGTYLDARAAWDYLVNVRNLRPDRVVIFGRSLGGGPATWLASQVFAAGLVLESTFTSMPDLAAYHYPLFPVRQLLKVHYPSVERIATIDTPVLVVHSPRDETVPFEHGRRLYEAAREPRHFIEISGRHADGFIDSGEHYVDGLRRFFDSL